MQSAQSISLNSSKNIIIRNSFFLWCHGLILLLTAIPVVSYLISAIFHTPQWTVLKIYELKMYAIAMAICALLPLSNKYIPALIQKEHPRYQLYLLLFFPLSTLFYSFSGINEFARYLFVFLFSVLGVAILYYDIRHANFTQYPFVQHYYNKLLLASLLFCIFVIMCSSRVGDDMVFSFSLWSFAALILVLSLLWIANFCNKYVILLLPVFLYLVAFLSTGSVDVLHYGFFIGPVTEVLYGHFHPFMLDTQYGNGLTAFLALYFKLKGGVISLANMQQLLKTLTFIQYLLLYFIANALYRSRKIAFIALLAVLFFNLYSQSAFYYKCPSIGFLRFGFIYLILFCYSLEGKLFSQRTGYFITAIIGSIAVLWSFESAIYTLPALLFAEYSNKNLRKFLPIFLSCFCIIAFAYLSPIILQGQQPLFSRYYEYATVYAGGFGQVSLDRAISFWWLFPLLYGFFLIKVMSGSISNKIVAALTIYGAAIFTYYAGRAASNNLFHISIPFILLTIYLVIDLKSVSLFMKQTLIVLIFVTFASANQQWVSHDPIIKGFFDNNLSIVKNQLWSFMQTKQFIADKELEEENCAIYSPLKKYIKNGAIPLLGEDQYFYRVYTCMQTHNTFSANPYLETTLNPRAVKRLLQKANSLPIQYILVDSELLKKKVDIVESETTPMLLKQFHAKKVEELNVGKFKIVVFSVEPKEVAINSK